MTVKDTAAAAASCNKATIAASSSSLDDNWGSIGRFMSYKYMLHAYSADGTQERPLAASRPGSSVIGSALTDKSKQQSH